MAPAPEAQPDVGFLPSLLRRRLDRPGRMALYTAWRCAEGLDSVQFVFASRHGALNRTVELLTALAKNEVLSPTVFSLSVHNSVAGLFSIARGDRSAATAMAAGEDSLGLCILEGANMVAEGTERVLITYADDLAPDPYRSQVTEPSSHPFAISLLLTAADAAPLRCRLMWHAGMAPEPPGEKSLIRLLTGDASQALLGVDQTWRLERTHAG